MPVLSGACDASPFGVSAILSHQFDDGSERPIAFASRSLSDAEKKYSHLDKEALAIIFGVTKFHQYVFGRPVTILTDHKPLLGLFGEGRPIPDKASSRVIRWAITLSGYDYELKYRRGSDNNADALSRLPLSEKPTSVPIPADVLAVLSLLDSSPITCVDIAKATENDPVLSRVLQFIMNSWPESDTDPDLKPFMSRRNEISVDNGCLLWGSRVIIPEVLQKRIADLLHDGHIGMSRMKAQARGYVWWPKMDATLENLARSCPTCCEHRNTPPHAPLHPWEWPDGPWSRLHIDFAGPFLGKMFLLVIDAHSKWIEVLIMSNDITASSTILQLRKVFAVHGLPEVIVSDNGPTFTSNCFGAFLSHNGVRHVRCSPFHPASNGLAERAVQIFKRGLKTNTNGTLEERVLHFLTKYRSTPQSTTGLTPAQLLFGRKLKTHLDLLFPDTRTRVMSSQRTQKINHDKTASSRHFETDDQVYYRNFSRGPKWLSGTITEKTGPVSFQIEGQSGIVRRHQDHIFSAPGGNRPELNSSVVSEMDDSVSSVVRDPTPTEASPQIRDPGFPPNVTEPEEEVPDMVATPTASLGLTRKSTRTIRPPKRLDL